MAIDGTSTVDPTDDLLVDAANALPDCFPASWLGQLAYRTPFYFGNQSYQKLVTASRPPETGYRKPAIGRRAPMDLLQAVYMAARKKRARQNIKYGKIK